MPTLLAIMFHHSSVRDLQSTTATAEDIMEELMDPDYEDLEVRIRERDAGPHYVHIRH